LARAARGWRAAGQQRADGHDNRRDGHNSGFATPHDVPRFRGVFFDGEISLSQFIDEMPLNFAEQERS
jgi:hypothetical protein